MPSHRPIPTVGELLDAYAGAVSGRRAAGDLHRGGTYDVFAGIMALGLHKVSVRQRDLFRQVYFATATLDALDDILARRWPDVNPRVQDTRGTGTAKISRPSSGTAETIWEGTRIGVVMPGRAVMAFYRVSQDTAVGSSATQAVLPIEAAVLGSGTAISVQKGDAKVLGFEDVLVDNTWRIDQLTCSAGTDREKDDAVKARVVQERFDNREGYVARISKAMFDAGAEVVAMFASDYLGSASDVGLNRIYVGRSNFESTTKLLEDCRKALPAVVIAGTAVQVLPMTRVALSMQLAVSLWDTPDAFALAELEREIKNATLGYFDSRKNAFHWRSAGVHGAVQRASQTVQSVTITPSQAEPVLANIFNTVPLPRYTLDASAITVTFTGPL